MKRKALYMAALLGFAIAVPQFAFAKDDPSSTSTSSDTSSSSSSDKSSSGATGAGTESDTGGSRANRGVVMAEQAQWQATIESIDKQNRSVTLKTADGETKTVKLDRRVRNFDQLKAGDQVKVRALDAVALSLAKPGETPSVSTNQTTMVAPEGNRPAAVMAETVQKTATVEAIDHDKRTVTLKGPEGNTVSMKVDPSVKEFTQLKQGDKINVVQTQAVAIEVTPQAQGGTGGQGGTGSSGSSGSSSPNSSSGTSQ
jgi:hypothetical protein